MSGSRLKESSDESASSGPTATPTYADILAEVIGEAKQPVLPRLERPSDTEAELFYLGLPSQPRLLGRASAGEKIWDSIDSQMARWASQPGHPSHFVARKQALGNIGRHAIRSCWEHYVQPKIIAAIDDLPWSSVDVLRIGDSEVALSERAVVVWVGLQNANVPWRKMELSIRACRVVLDFFELPDVDIQFRLSSIVSLAGLGPHSGPLDLGALEKELAGDAEMSFLLDAVNTQPGHSLSSFFNPHIQATIGVYLRPALVPSDNNEDKCKQKDRQEKPAPFWALTVRHGALPGKDNSEYRHHGDVGLPPLAIGFPSQKTINTALLIIRDLESGRRQQSPEERKLVEMLKDLESLESRRAGTVFLAPPISKCETPISWTRDWCLVEMEPRRFPDNKPPTNVTSLVSMEMPILKIKQTLWDRGQPTFDYPESLQLRLFGVIPLTEILNPPGPIKNQDGDHCIVVAKRGAATNLTYGCPSELMSTVRQCHPDGVTTFVSQEWAIHGCLHKRTVPFSAPGDSGSVVFGMDGRLGGFITRGTDPNQGRSVDITYATPAALVLADIEDKLGYSVELL